MRCAVILLGLLLVGSGGAAEEECQAELTGPPVAGDSLLALAGKALPQGHLLQEDEEAQDEDAEFEDGEEDQDDETDAPKFKLQKVKLPRRKTCSGSSSVIDTSGKGRACKKKCKASAACKAIAFSKKAKECRSFSACDTFADATGTGRWMAFKKVPKVTPPAPTPAPPPPAPAPQPMGGSVTAEAVKAWKLLNQLRKAGTTCGSQRKAPAKKVLFDCRLWKASILHAEDMLKHNYFSHKSKDGRSPWERAREQGIEANGENIAKGQSTPESVTNSWQKSEGHCNNMMNPSTTMVGIGYAKPYWVEMLTNSRKEADTSCLPTVLSEVDLEGDDVADYVAEVLSTPGDVDVPAERAQED